MIENVDEFVFLDSVQFAKRSWQQRNRIKSDKGELMLSIPVSSKGKSDQLICDVLINKDDPNFKKIVPTIKNYYSKSPFFKTYSEEIFHIFENSSEFLEDLNVSLIKYFMSILGIDSSKLSYSKNIVLDTRKAELLADICEAKKAKVYLSAPGSRQYIEESGIFEKKDIEVLYHNYRHPQYPQLYNEFIPYLGVIDLIFNVGPESRKVMLEGLKG